ncbi:hypothetical protein [Streptomyces sp. H27-C3]|uniref:hypothetical protein n=1 Tax=Streptomyces sp. H27-C3 TaxID=3046305 RepID=UPI0024B904F4|nr:hypothetical protein [Streptomyces sp. H27-C3]MDJ0466968.1 hypothetical protein [Streptomyces sp. H27-C3]
MPRANSQGHDERLTLAALRILGADALLPAALSPEQPVDEAGLALMDRSLLAHTPSATAPATALWSHWAMDRAVRRLRSPSPTTCAPEPDTQWLHGTSWQMLTHQLAVLSALAVPGAACGVSHLAASRPVDVARGFVRAVRRRDWLQAAGAGRWLTLLDGVPPSLGLDTGLEFVAQMGAPDARVALQVQAARMLRPGAAQ